MTTTTSKPDVRTLAAVSQDGTRLAVDATGHGPAVVCVDGALSTRSLGPGKALAPHLAEHFTVYTYDRRGRGDSGDTAQYEPRREVEDLAAVIAAAGGEAMVFGHSSGAVLALEAATAGLPITRLALYEPSCIVDDSRNPVGKAWAEELAEMLAAGRNGRAVRRFMAVVAEAPRFVGVLMCLTPMFKRVKATAPSLAYDIALMAPYQSGRPLPDGAFANVATPARLLLGGKSPAWIANASRALEQRLEAAELCLLDGQTHMLKPKVTAPVVQQFFSAEESAEGGRGRALAVAC